MVSGNYVCCVKSWYVILSLICPDYLYRLQKLTRVLGGRINGASPSYTIGEMVNALKTAGTKYIMTVASSIKMASAAAKEVGIPSERILLMDGDLEGYTSIQQLSVIGRNYGLDRQVPYYSIPAGQTNDVCGYLNFSSGTTGLPKAVSHRSVYDLWGG